MPQGSAYSDFKTKVAPPTKKKVKKHYKIFFKYMSERYQIYKRRQAGKKHPWTKDKILRDHHFTNVFRIHDRGSQWLLMHIRPAVGELPGADGKKVSKKELVWRVVQYRWPNYHTLFEDYGWIPRGFNREKWHKRILKTKESRGQWHTTAHIVLQSNFHQTRAENYLDYLHLLDEDFDKFYNGIVKAESMEAAFKHVKKFKGFGGFTAYEILIDLCYLGIIPDSWRDDFANAGPGCKEGIDLIFPNRQHLTYPEAMTKLRDEQTEAFEKYGLKPTPYLTLQDIEFNLCEIGKYIKSLNGLGKKRKYHPYGEPKTNNKRNSSKISK